MLVKHTIIRFIAARNAFAILMTNFVQGNRFNGDSLSGLYLRDASFGIEEELVGVPVPL